MVDPRVVTDSVIALLDSVTTVLVTDHVPADDVTPRITVYVTSGGMVDGVLGEPDDELTVPVQLTVVSTRRDQCQWLQNLTRSTLLAQTLTFPSYSLFRVRLEVPSGVQREDKLGESEGRRFYSTDVFHLTVVP